MAEARPLRRWVLKQDVAGLKQDVAGLKQDVGALKQDLAAMESRLENRLDNRITGLAAALRTEMAQQGAELRAELHRSIGGVTRQMYTAILGQMAVLVGLRLFLRRPPALAPFFRVACRIRVPSFDLTT